MIFRNTEGGSFSLNEVMNIITQKIQSRPESMWTLAIGTDSQNKRKHTNFCQVILLHEIGNGGIFFYSTHKQDKIPVITLRMLEETKMSIDITKEVVDDLENRFYAETFDFTQYNIKLEIHCDLGYNGKSKDAIQSALGWISSEFGGYVDAKIKPESVAASCIADGHTR